MESLPRTDCIVHGQKWRCPFQCLLNKVRAVYSIHNKHINLWPQLICLCELSKDRYKTAWKHVCDDDLLDQALSSLEKKQDDSVTAMDSTRPADIKELQPFLKLLNLDSNHYSNLSELGQRQVCIVRLVYLIIKAVTQDFTLTASFITAPSVILPEEPEIKDISFSQPLSGVYLSYLIGKSGTRIKMFARANKCNKMTLEQDVDNAGHVKVALTTKNAADNQVATLTDAFSSFVQTSSSNYKFVKACIERKSKSTSWIRGRAYSFPHTDKLTRQEDFLIKNKQHQKAREKSTRPQKNVLAYGHCLQCRKPFTGLKQTEACIFHSGFIVTHKNQSVWSCCDVNTVEHAQTHDDHYNKGCCSASTHQWRVNKKQDKHRVSVTRRRHQTDIPPIHGHHVYDML